MRWKKGNPICRGISNRGAFGLGLRSPILTSPDALEGGLRGGMTSWKVSTRATSMSASLPRRHHPLAFEAVVLE